MIVEGYKISWHHKVLNGPKYKALTTCTVIGEAMGFLKKGTTGTAYCSIKDQFSKESGRKLSLKRAIASFPKDLRTKIWTAYLSR